MNRIGTVLVCTLAMMVVANAAFACMAAPPQGPVWKTPKGESFQYSFDVNTKEVVVADAKDQSKVLWKTTLKNYSYGSWFYPTVIDEGKRVVTYRLNRGTAKVTDVVVESVHQDGTRTELAANDFIQALQPHTGPRHSMSPAKLWMKNVEKMDGKEIVVTNALGVKKTKAWANTEVAVKESKN